jgi:hypothetical protein
VIVLISRLRGSQPTPHSASPNGDAQYRASWPQGCGASLRLGFGVAPGVGAQKPRGPHICGNGTDAEGTLHSDASAP